MTVCLCGCGERVVNVKGTRKRHYLNTEHYEAHRALMRRSMGRKAAAEDELEDVHERRLSEEMAPILSKEAWAVRASGAVRLITGPASHALWGACLGVVL